MNPNRCYKYSIRLCFLCISFGITAQTDLMKLVITEKGNEQWKDRIMVLSNGKSNFDQIKCVIKSGTLSEHLEFRRDATDFSQIIMAETCDALQWGEFELISLPKNFKKPLDKMFYLNIYEIKFKFFVNLNLPRAQYLNLFDFWFLKREYTLR